VDQVNLSEGALNSPKPKERNEGLVDPSPSVLSSPSPVKEGAIISSPGPVKEGANDKKKTKLKVVKLKPRKLIINVS